MRIRWSALAVIVLTLVLMPRVGQSQVTQPEQKKSVVSMGQNFPNPFNPESRIQFTVGGYPSCAAEPVNDFETPGGLSLLSSVL
ncbi:MAG: hypothetical protein O2973_06240 [Gemmatimonadetes bacterium]|nr:hypothetical protein [Gemmatimonadota bacterium]